MENWVVLALRLRIPLPVPVSDEACLSKAVKISHINVFPGVYNFVKRALSVKAQTRMIRTLLTRQFPHPNF